MIKNIVVVDEQGKEYGATWPRRAKGLVKNGRARFISENKICLACPPDFILEDKEMSDRENMEMDVELGTAEAFANLDSEEGQTVNLAYILKQMEKIQEQTAYLNKAIDGLGKMTDGDSGETGAPGNIMGAEKAKALGDIVRCRETTNQSLLKLYEKMYNDMPARIAARAQVFDMIKHVVGNPNMDSEDVMAIVSNILNWANTDVACRRD